MREGKKKKQFAISKVDNISVFCPKVAKKKSVNAVIATSMQKMI